MHQPPVDLEWGVAGARYAASPRGAVVVVDVLSFSTAVTLLAGYGTAVYPAPVPDVDAEEAVPREEATAERPWSLSPAHLLAAAKPDRLVLPSPNGAAVAAVVS